MTANRDRSGMRLICIFVEPGRCGGLAVALPRSRRCIPYGKERCHPRRSPHEMGDDSYKRVLDLADDFFRGVMAAQPQNLQCGRGCSLCCHGLFEIGSADVALIAEGLASLHPMRRMMIIRRAVEIVASSAHPNLRE